MENKFVVVSIFVLTIIVIIFCGMFVIYLCGFERTIPTIKFNHFLKMYSITPEKWRLWTDYVCYCGDCLQFKFIDTLRYKIWNNKRIKKREKEEADEITIKLLKSWQQDINDYQDKFQKELIKGYVKNYKILGKIDEIKIEEKNNGYLY